MSKCYSCLIALFLCVLSFNAAVFSEEMSAINPINGSVEVSSDALDVPEIRTEVMTSHNGISEYRLGAGDKIKIHVFREPDMDVEMRLGASGDIRYPFLGRIHVMGMTLPDLQRRITDDLSNGYLIDPQVRVSMEEFRPFYVNGEVKSPGAYPYQPGLTVRKAISLAGGFTVDADKHKMFLIHAADIHNEELHVLLGQRMGPGDILTIKRSYFFVNGEVKKPGKYSYQTDMTYRMAIAIAGGLKEKSNDDKVYVVHEGKGQQTTHVKDLDAEIQAGDMIIAEEGFF